jgi:hypothetical protein
MPQAFVDGWLIVCILFWVLLVQQQLLACVPACNLLCQGWV